MKKVILGILAIVLIGWALFDYVSNEATKNETKKNNSVISSNTDDDVIETNAVGTKRGSIAPQFELETIDGKVISLEDLRGKKVFINFWATWCPPCRAEMPDIQRFYEDEEVVVLAVNLTHTEDSLSTVRGFIEDGDFTFPVLVDQEGKVAEMYKVNAYPTSYLIDSDGRIQYIALGAMNYDLMVKEFGKLE
ncbi:peroxiredoxin [Bacillus oleivorans]|uniref:Peroxiredoxin n=1 Tax=Bacillus oleivorans TaxID=1448271 RepID=A0A285D648_9BACI|nr:TlpA disulfide reductase family protein [Bacillus oleivorans]SNX75135.1 peroxiredoxin [Bacillus oleivorans]